MICEISQEETLAASVMTCRLPRTHKTKVPLSVSIVEKKCDHASTNLKVIYNIPTAQVEKKRFCVCSKGFSILEDESVEVAEWFEILRALGADKIDLYTLEIHPNIARVIDYYTREGLIESAPLYLPGKAITLSRIIL